MNQGGPTSLKPNSKSELEDHRLIRIFEREAPACEAIFGLVNAADFCVADAIASDPGCTLTKFHFEALIPDACSAQAPALNNMRRRRRHNWKTEQRWEKLQKILREFWGTLAHEGI
ncbi:hypothetical protein [Methylobacterium nigriterrae]|uniref:hypothetical protein n=1 Tax=Methylobacterium nigriterrae TaxID=3127512 RepID=UPI0030134E44